MSCGCSANLGVQFLHICGQVSYFLHLFTHLKQQYNGCLMLLLCFGNCPHPINQRIQMKIKDTKLSLWDLCNKCVSNLELWIQHRSDFIDDCCEIHTADGRNPCTSQYPENHIVHRGLEKHPKWLALAFFPSNNIFGYFNISLVPFFPPPNPDSLRDRPKSRTGLAKLGAQPFWDL